MAHLGPRMPKQSTMLSRTALQCLAMRQSYSGALEYLATGQSNFGAWEYHPQRDTATREHCNTSQLDRATLAPQADGGSSNTGRSTSSWLRSPPHTCRRFITSEAHKASFQGHMSSLGGHNASFKGHKASLGGHVGNLKRQMGNLRGHMGSLCEEPSSLTKGVKCPFSRLPFFLLSSFVLVFCDQGTAHELPFLCL